MATAELETAPPLAQPPQTQWAGWSLADLQDHLCDIPAHRIRLHPAPGTATEEDLVELEAREDRLFELFDGTIVEKPMGWYESLVGVLISSELAIYVRREDLGHVLGADGMLRILQWQIREPDVCFISWDRFPADLTRETSAAPIAPDLAVEVLSKTNTVREMERKLREYFEAGVLLVWYIDPVKRTARIFTSPEDVTEIPPDGELTGDPVLPGLRISLEEIFAQADRRGPKQDAPGK